MRIGVSPGDEIVWRRIDDLRHRSKRVRALSLTIEPQWLGISLYSRLYFDKKKKHVWMRIRVSPWDETVWRGIDGLMHRTGVAMG